MNPSGRGALRVSVPAPGTTRLKTASRCRERWCRTVHGYERRVSARLRPRSLPIGIIHDISANPASRRSAIKGRRQFKTFAAVLVAASVLTAPAFAQGTAPAPTAPATQMTKAPTAKVVKAKKHSKVKKHAHVRKHVKHVRHARHGRHHVKHASAKPAHAVQTVGSAPKAGTN